MNQVFSSLRFLFVLGVFALPFIACSDDDGDGGGGSIEGRWQMTFVETSDCNDPADNTQFDLTTDNCFEVFGVETCFDIVYQFNADGTYESIATTTTTALGQTTTDTDTEAGTYTVNGNNITICDDDNDCSMGQFTVSGNNITLTYQDDPDDGCDGELRGTRI